MRGRKPKTDRPKEWKVRLPSSVANAVEELLYDPITDKPAFGERSKLVEKLLRKYLKERGIDLTPNRRMMGDDT